jgi:NAD(P)-dependent dehydrogenase (short-subunit alcohol dehydrogenase family)
VVLNCTEYHRRLGRYCLLETPRVLPCINSVSPGPTDTPAPLAGTEAQRTTAAARTLFNRLGRPHELAPAYAFLLSRLATFITGSVTRVTGGAAP